ncbi:MAG: heme o synthase [Gammaproteobacteria bacterium]
MSASESLLMGPVPRPGLPALIRAMANVCKLRIGVTIAFTALAGIAVAQGAALAGWQVAVVFLAVLVSAAAAGGFNQYMERDLDAVMRRTCDRPFVNGTLAHGRGWLVALAALLGVSVLATAWATNLVAAAYVFLGAFFYGFVYTVWLKRRTALNIVVGGLAGSFAIMAGASAVSPEPQTLPLLFALVLFLWTPSHFWSFAIAMHDDYLRARVPMLPVVIGPRATAWVVLVNTVLLVAASLLPYAFGMGPVYLAAALLGGGLFLRANLRLLRRLDRGSAMASFHASLAQLTLVLTGAMLDAPLMAVL